MGFEQCKIEPDTWLKCCGDHYEHIAVCVDDLLESNDLKGLLEIVTNKNKIKIKGTGPM